VRKRLHAFGLRFRIHYPLPGLKRRTSDIAFPGLRIAVFLDGCFWHSCPVHRSVPKTNAAFWAEKLKQNVMRDRSTNRHLEVLGWTSLRFWTHQTSEEIALAIHAAVSNRPEKTGNSA
jgi:DNA mismatch endonuclease (patch repair protein)